MIESLRTSRSRFLALFAACTFGVGFLVGGAIVRLFHTNTAAGDPCNCGLELIAAAAAKRLGSICIILEILSFLVVAYALIKTDPNDPNENDPTLLLLSARALYLLSFIFVVATISAGMLFMMFHI